MSMMSWREIAVRVRTAGLTGWTKAGGLILMIALCFILWLVLMGVL
jgi:hypothetical protein